MRYSRLIPLAVLSVNLFLAGCEGDDGSIGPVGPTGTTGPAGPAGPQGNNGVTSVTLQFLGRYESGVFDEGAAEIVAYYPAGQEVFQVNANTGQVDIIDISSPATPALTSSIDVAMAIAMNTSFTTALGSVNSVAIDGDLVAAAIAADEDDDRGFVAFFNATDSSFIGATEVGFLPDAVEFTPDGNTVVVANEGQPLDDYSVDPEGSISLIDVATNGGAAATAIEVGFTDFNAGGSREGELEPGVRIFGPGATVAEDLEPEYIAFTADSSTAFVALQENNALAVVDLAGPTIASILPLGTKDHSIIGNELDASDRDGERR